MSWLYLVLAGFFEVAFAIALKLSDGFTKTKYIVLFILFSACSFYLLSKSLTKIPIGTAYLVWTGIGGVGAVIIGILFFNEPATYMRIFFIALAIISIIGLKLS
ncbi:DMT family transporter [Candidatus Aquarickettsia rohweri]|uniref:Guanidinium exporter n=1 Tax=Candidatus Aquarickettsia rohweri TaxID=2602574 RepID=A0A3R9ZIT3_9RICK|nr:multidrug efflux SMR transporter [Candidatus Aquarickettsia rohweri]MSO13421.1 Quaternary ammonium compound-resistance protein SugE [Rickettsiales endosymbiont of Trichoplax sp. H2]RST63388.1 multidrug efflux SMR transporter [Candidatus Aquarickettsia rohweri]